MALDGYTTTKSNIIDINRLGRYGYRRTLIKSCLYHANRQYLLCIWMYIIWYIWKIYNIMAADALAPYIARTSAATILTMQNKWVLVLFEEGFQLPASYQCGEMTQNVNICLYSLCKNLARKGLKISPIVPQWPKRISFRFTVKNAWKPLKLKYDKNAPQGDVMNTISFWTRSYYIKSCKIGMPYNVWRYLLLNVMRNMKLSLKQVV